MRVFLFVVVCGLASGGVLVERWVLLGLVSGGVDSCTAALHALECYCRVPRGLGVERECFAYAVSFRYGQRHGREVEAARRFAERYGFRHLVVDAPVLSAGVLLGEGFRGVGSALTGDVGVPVEAPAGRVPVTYVPQRNLVLLSLASSVLELLLRLHDGDVGVLVVGFQAGDSAPGEPVYPDTRRVFVSAVEAAVNLGSGRVFEGRSRVIVHAPWVDEPKWRVILWGLEHGMDYSLTWTCYRGGERACGRCPACLHRLRSFVAAGVPDPLPYETYPGWYERWLGDLEACRRGDRGACARVEAAVRDARNNRLPYGGGSS